VLTLTSEKRVVQSKIQDRMPITAKDFKKDIGIANRKSEDASPRHPAFQECGNEKSSCQS
jgi:hypothetical protein